jgi:hypothetical protein
MKLDLIGERFGKLLVIAEGETRSKWKRYFLCKCDCGKEKEIYMGSLRRGLTTSCGCLASELFGLRNTKHGMSDSPEYNSWRAMKERCNNPKNSHYHLYGGRGISYPIEWENFENFFADMGRRPEGKTLDRIDVNANYSKENCKWSDISEQNTNTRVRKDNKLGVKGINKVGRKFLVRFRGLEIGRFDNIEDAISFRKKYESGELTLTEDQLEKIKKRNEKVKKWKDAQKVLH